MAKRPGSSLDEEMQANGEPIRIIEEAPNPYPVTADREGIVDKGDKVNRYKNGVGVPRRKPGLSEAEQEMQDELDKELQAAFRAGAASERVKSNKRYASGKKKGKFRKNLA